MWQSSHYHDARGHRLALVGVAPSVVDDVQAHPPVIERRRAADVNLGTSNINPRPMIEEKKEKRASFRWAQGGGLPPLAPPTGTHDSCFCLPRHAFNLYPRFVAADRVVGSGWEYSVTPLPSHSPQNVMIARTRQPVKSGGVTSGLVSAAPLRPQRPSERDDERARTRQQIVGDGLSPPRRTPPRDPFSGTHTTTTPASDSRLARASHGAIATPAGCCADADSRAKRRPLVPGDLVAIDEGPVVRRRLDDLNVPLLVAVERDSQVVLSAVTRLRFGDRDHRHPILGLGFLTALNEHLSVGGGGTSSGDERVFSFVHDDHDRAGCTSCHARRHRCSDLGGLLTRDRLSLQRPAQHKESMESM